MSRHGDIGGRVSDYENVVQMLESLLEQVEEGGIDIDALVIIAGGDAGVSVGMGSLNALEAIGLMEVAKDVVLEARGGADRAIH